MPLPAFALPVAAVAALGGLYLYTRKPAPKIAATAAITFPPELRADYDRLLNAPDDQDPSALENVATRLDALGFKQEATSLRLKAAKLRAAQSTPVGPGVF
jgi:hypothetical protein